MLNRPAIAAVALFAAWNGYADESSAIHYKPLSLGAISEFGMLQSGRFSQNPAFSDEWVDHFGAHFVQTAEIDDRWIFNIGLGGIFEFQKPEVENPEWGGTQYKSFFVGPSVADLEYKVIEEDAKGLRLGLGMFGYKYNPDAANLGEYLFRTGPYPNYIMTGGYALLNNSSATLQGLKAYYRNGGFAADFFLTTETVMPPLYDLSLAGMFKYRVADGLLEVGLGVNAKRLVPIRPSKTSPHTASNAYFTVGGVDYSGKEAYYAEQSKFYQRILGSAGNAADSAKWIGQRDYYGQLADSVHIWASPGDSNLAYFTNRGSLANAADTAALLARSGIASLKYYTQSGIIADFMVSLDLKKLFPSDLFGPNDMRIFAEAALLGIQDYPVFYTKKTERLPIMVGVNLPGFRFFDLISVQVERYASPNINSFYESLSSNEATPEIARGNDSLFSQRAYMDVKSKDDLSWSVLVKKQLVPGLFLTAQAARDHSRMVSEKTYAGPMLDANEVLYTSKNWYWMVQFGFAI